MDPNALLELNISFENSNATQHVANKVLTKYFESFLSEANVDNDDSIEDVDSFNLEESDGDVPMILNNETTHEVEKLEQYELQ